MRAALAGGVLALLLVCSGCRAEPAPAPSDRPEVSLDAESERLEGELAEVSGLAEVDVRLRSGATFGRQVLVEGSTEEAADIPAVLDELTRAGWHTRAFVPTEVRVTLVDDDGQTRTPKELGFARHGADAVGLFDRYGPPAADEDWQP